MRTRGELSLTLSILALVLMTVGSIMGVTLANKSLTRSSDASSGDGVVSSSRWFTSNPGLACNAWFTCTSSGAKIQGMWLAQNGVTYRLGEESNSFADRNGKSFINKTMSSCQGGDETVSIQYNPDAIGKMSATFKKSYNVDEDSIIVSINTGGGAKTDFYVYDIPEGFDTKADARYVLDFDGTTSGVPTRYSQDTSVKGCLNGVVGTQTSPKPSPETPSDKPTTVTWNFQQNKEIGFRFGKAVKFEFYTSICKVIGSFCEEVMAGHTPILHPSNTITQTIDNAILDNSNESLIIDYFYKDTDENKLDAYYITRHLPYFLVKVERNGTIVKTCSKFPQGRMFECEGQIKRGDHIAINTIFTNDIVLNFLGQLPANTDTLTISIVACNADGTGCHGNGDSIKKGSIPQNLIASFPVSTKSQLIKVTGQYLLNGAPKTFSFPIKAINPQNTPVNLECTNNPKSISCVDNFPSSGIDPYEFLKSPRTFEIDLNQAVEIPAADITPSVAPSGQPSPEPSKPADGLEIPLDLWFTMDSDKFDWVKMTEVEKVYVLIQMCDSDEKLKNCTGPNQEVFSKTYNVEDITSEHGQEAIYVKAQKGKKILSMAMRYIYKNGQTANLGNHHPHMPFMRVNVYQNNMTDVKSGKYLQCISQGTQVFCGLEIIDNVTYIDARINSITRIDLNHWGDSFENPSALLNPDDKIKTYAQVYIDKDLKNTVYESSPVILDSKSFSDSSYSRLAHFPSVRVFDKNSFVAYVLNIEYLPGQNTPVIPKPAWIDLEEDFDCRSDEAKLPSGNMLYRRICTFKPNTIMSRLEVESHLIDFAFEKFTLDPLVNSEASTEVMNLAKELRSSDINKDKVITILDLTAVFDAYYTTGDVPEDINNDGIVNIQDAMIVVSHLSESAP